MATRGGYSAAEARDVWGWTMWTELPGILDAVESAPYAAVVTAPEVASEMWGLHPGAELPGIVEAFDPASYPAVATAPEEGMEVWGWNVAPELPGIPDAFDSPPCAAVATAPEEVREVWGYNLGAELPEILDALDSAPYVAVDTEFPGFLHQTPRFASPRNRYQYVRRNVDSLKLIQLGLSFFGDGGRRRTWQISFRDFDVSSGPDARSEASVELLKRSGVDLGRTRREGVDSAVLSEMLRRSDWAGRCKSRWVTFQGLYDVAYLVKLLTGAPLPPTLPGFAQLAGATLGTVIDVKYLSRFCGGFHLGLARLSETLGLKVEGGAAHQAGVDALLTGKVFQSRMQELPGGEEDFEGILHGIEEERIAAQLSAETEQAEEHLLMSRAHPPSTPFVAYAVVFPPMLIRMTALLPGFYED